MPNPVLDGLNSGKIRGPRRDSGNDRWDEVWDGSYILMPNPDIEHQGIAGGLTAIFGSLVVWTGHGSVYQGVNVSDQTDDWTLNFRCPDVAVYLDGNPALARVESYLGGPDLAVEILSPDDRSREKLEFYAKVGVRELLFIDRDPWALELFQRRGTGWAPAGRSRPEGGESFVSTVIPLRFALVPGDPRPSLAVSQIDGPQQWAV